MRWENLSLSAKKRKLWAVFSPWIKKRDKYRCVTCGKRVEGQNAQGGHYIAKAACGLEYYFSEKNVHCQCGGCNLFLEGNRHKYREYLLKKYGEDAVKDLENNYHKPCNNYPFKEKFEYYSSNS